VNSVSFLTYNVDGGDGRDTWMWTAPDERWRFDVSKLEQWEIAGSLRMAPACVVAKGGITSSDIATEVLGIVRARVLGQILPGVPVWATVWDSSARTRPDFSDSSAASHWPRLAWT